MPAALSFRVKGWLHIHDTANIAALNGVYQFADTLNAIVCSILWTQEGKTAMDYAKEKSDGRIFELLKQVLRK